MQVADSRMIASVGSMIARVLAVLDPDVARGVHDYLTHRSVLLFVARRPRVRDRRRRHDNQ